MDVDRVYEKVLVMLEKRGLDLKTIRKVSNYNYNCLKSEHLNYENKLSFFISAGTVDDGDNILVFFSYSEPKAKNKNKLRLISSMICEKITIPSNSKVCSTNPEDFIAENGEGDFRPDLPKFSSIIAVNNEFSSNSVKSQIGILGLTKKIQTFRYDELLIDIFSSAFNSSEFTKLTGDELVEFTKNITSKKINIPQFDFNDPVRKYFDFSKGDIIKVLRQNMVSGSSAPISFHYRRV